MGKNITDTSQQSLLLQLITSSEVVYSAIVAFQEKCGMTFEQAADIVTAAAMLNLSEVLMNFNNLDVKFNMIIPEHPSITGYRHKSHK